MQYLRRRATAEGMERNADAVGALLDRPRTVAGLAGDLEAAVLVELLRPAARVGDAVRVPREHHDLVLDELHGHRRRIATLDRIPLGLVNVRRSRLYRRGDRGVEADDVGSAREARERYRAARRRETKWLTGTVSFSVALGAASVLAGGALSSPVLLVLGVSLLVGLVPAAVAIWQYYRGVKDRLLDARYRREAETLRAEVGDCEVRIVEGKSPS